MSVFHFLSTYLTMFNRTYQYRVDNFYVRSIHNEHGRLKEGIFYCFVFLVSTINISGYYFRIQQKIKDGWVCLRNTTKTDGEDGEEEIL